jgi:predicted membrane-bound spermidine synthase
MSEKTSTPKKMVSTNVAVALGILCIILIAALGVVVYMAYAPTSNSLQSIVNLQDSYVWVNDQTVSQGAGSFSTWSSSETYAGYVVVSVLSSTVSGTHVQVTYSAYGVNFDQTQVVSAGSTAVFPILPCSDVTVGVGNGNILSSATETVTITYYY